MADASGFNDGKQLVINSSQVPGIIGANLRYGLTAFASYALGHGWFDTNQAAQFVTLGLVVVPWAWGVVSTWMGKKRVLAAAVKPPSQITVK